LKKVISLALVLVLLLGCIGLAACGGGEEGTPPPNGEATPPSNGGAAPPSGGGLTWNDMPVYSGAKQVQKGSWSIPPEQGEWSKMEWRYYETGDSSSKAASFYKSQMPGEGWQEMAWMEVEEVSWGYYSKNDEQDGAMVWVGSDEGKTSIALMRATQ